MTAADLLKIVRWIFCWHDWRDALGQVTPVGMKVERCAKCPATRCTHLKLLSK